MDTQRIISIEWWRPVSHDPDVAYRTAVDWLWTDRIYSSIEEDPFRILIRELQVDDSAEHG
jgi:hypothetical protein